MHSKRIREKVKQDYNSIAEEFSETRRRGWPEFALFAPYLMLSTPLNVLDLGCGNGRLLEFLKNYDVNVKSYLGVDQSKELLRQAKLKCAEFLGEKRTSIQVEFLEADMLHLPHFEQKFDRVFMIASFHHLPPRDQIVFLEQLKTHLKPGAVIFMTNWNFFSFRFWRSWLRMFLWPAYGYKGLLIPWKHEIDRYYYAFTLRQLRKLLERAGFKVLSEFKGRNLITVAQL